MRIQNFGKNITFEPADFYQPTSEQEVLEILRANRGRRIRTIGRLHSWSDAPKSDDVLLDLRYLNTVEIEEGGETRVKLGAGCQLKRAIKALDHAGLALPSQGLITEQAIAGAISTGTHGSGKNSLSHYVEEITVAVYDPQTGEPVVRAIRDGPELLAARCSLGCTGVILSVTLPCQSQYQVEEHLRFYDNLSPVLDAEEDYPLQQFYLYPHSWRFMAAHRRNVEVKRSILAPLYHAYWFVCVDFALHLTLLLFACVFCSRWLVRLLFRILAPCSLIRGWKVVDKSQRMLTMEHELFRHIETEVFVKRSKLPQLLDFARELLEYCDGNSSAINDQTWSQLRDMQLSDRVEAMCGKYTHHYPITVRKVLPDATLISMASSDDEPYYAVSFVSYHRPDQRDEFFEFARILVDATARLFDARPHWGKWCPLDAETAARLYPRLPELRDVCTTIDPDGVFRNRWLDELLFEYEPVTSAPEHGS